MAASQCNQLATIDNNIKNHSNLEEKRAQYDLVFCRRNSRYFAGGQLAVFQGASEAPISK